MLIAGITLQKGSGGSDELLSLCRCDARRSVAEPGMVAQADLDEHQIFTVFHDEVELAQAAAEVAGHQRKPTRAEMIEGGGFCLGARPGPDRQSADPPVTTGRGSRRPLRISPQASSRRNRPEPSMVSRPVLPSS